MEKYKDIDATNQSSLKKILIHPKSYLQAKKKQERDDEEIPDHFVFGSVVDIMLTGRKEEFDEQFVRIPDSTKCSDTLKVIIDDVFSHLNEFADEIGDVIILELKEYKKHILKSARANNYYNNRKDDSLIELIIKE